MGRRLYLRSGQQPFFQPVFVAALLLIATLLLLRRTADDYVPVKTLLTWLGPATAALALPVYVHPRPAPFGASAACLWRVCWLASDDRYDARRRSPFGLSTPVLESLAPKSVTTAIAVELSRMQGGDQSLTASVVVLAGTIGAMLGPTLLSWARVRLPVARGIALGTISHAQGTAIALQEHEASGAVGLPAGARAGTAVPPRTEAVKQVLLHPNRSTSRRMPRVIGDVTRHRISRRSCRHCLVAVAAKADIQQV